MKHFHDVVPLYLCTFLNRRTEGMKRGTRLKVFRGSDMGARYTLRRGVSERQILLSQVSADTPRRAANRYDDGRTHHWRDTTIFCQRKCSAVFLRAILRHRHFLSSGVPHRLPRATCFYFGDALGLIFPNCLRNRRPVAAIYLDLLATVFLVVLVWAVVRRWIVTPKRLSFDLTQKWESAVILLLIAGLMVLSLLAEAMYVAAGGDGPTASAIVGSALGNTLSEIGISSDLANALHGVASWATRISSLRR